MSEEFQYDVFLSHSSQDKAVVRALAHRLRQDGLRVWFDEWEIRPGDLIPLKISAGLQQAKVLIMCMSAHFFASEWGRWESFTSLFRDPTNRQRRFIPLRLDEAEVEDALRPFAYVDWRQRSEEQYAQLLEACRSLASAVTSTSAPQSRLQPCTVLKGHKKGVRCVAVTSDGRLAISGSSDQTVRVWEVETQRCLAVLEGHMAAVRAVAVTADGRLAVSGGDDNVLWVWEVETGRCLTKLKGHTNNIWAVAITADGSRVVSGSLDKSVRVWEVDSGRCLTTLEGRSGVLSVAVTADGQRAVSGFRDRTVRVWEVETGRFTTLIGHRDKVYGLATTADGKRVISGSLDKTVRVWEVATGRCLAKLEGHTDGVLGVTVTANGKWAISGSVDHTVRVWKIKTGQCIATLQGHTNAVRGVAVTADGRQIISGSFDEDVRAWQLPQAKKTVPTPATTRYTNAKVLLVGDSGVGKSGLALRLIEDRFEATVSTDAAWATQLKLPHDASTGEIEREIWLWDFAGQADYRLVHQLFMDETALAVLVFNPQSENPFEGLGQWDRDLQKAARRRFNKLLVAGRCDRGGLMVSRESVERFRQERGFAEYLETSAYAGSGCAALREAIIRHIPWDDIPWTASPRIFKLLKEEIIKLKDEGRVLLRMGELKQQLEMRLPGESFTLEQLRAVVGLLAGPGVVWQLEFGDFVLLQPERINAYAAAVIRSVRAHTDEIGCIAEERVLAGDLDYQKPDNQKMERLPRDEEQIVLRAMHQVLIDHGLCLREHTEAGTLLVFPSYFKRERPDQPDHPSALVTYQFSGALDEIYATLVVKLHYTTTFEKDQLWRFAADFLTQTGRRVGFKMIKKVEGSAELTVYCAADATDDTKVTFIRYIHEHLKVKDPQVVRLRHYVCKCGKPVKDAEAVQMAIASGRKKIHCQYCGKQILLRDLIEEKFASAAVTQEVRELEETARQTLDNQSRELILVGHAIAIAAEAGQIFRPVLWADWGIDGEIEFKNDQGQASGRRIYLQLKSGDSYLTERKGDGKEVFRIKERRHAEYWLAQAYPVMLVIRTSDGQIRWVNVSEYLREHGVETRQIVFEGEAFTALNVARMRERILR